MPHFEIKIAICPHCGRQAQGEDEIEELFGYRYDGTVPQSWCRHCRSTRGIFDYSSSEEESLSVYDAAMIWLSHGKDEDYMFGYTEEELQEALE